MFHPTRLLTSNAKFLISKSNFTENRFSFSLKSVLNHVMQQNELVFKPRT